LTLGADPGARFLSARNPQGVQIHGYASKLWNGDFESVKWRAIDLRFADIRTTATRRGRAISVALPAALATSARADTVRVDGCQPGR